MGNFLHLFNHFCTQNSWTHHMEKQLQEGLSQISHEFHILGSKLINFVGKHKSKLKNTLTIHFNSYKSLTTHKHKNLLVLKRVLELLWWKGPKNQHLHTLTFEIGWTLVLETLSTLEINKFLKPTLWGTWFLKKPWRIYGWILED